jgi:hypothetical protein
VAINVAPRRFKVREGRFGRHEPQLHQLAGGVVNIDQQRARRRAVFEPPMIAAVDLDQLAIAGPAMARLVDLRRAQLARYPEAGVDHDPAHRLLGQLDAMALAQLLAGQRGTEVGVAVPDQAACARFQSRWQLPVPATAAFARQQSGGSIRAVALRQPLDLTPGQPELLCRPVDRQPVLGNGLNHLQSVYLPHGHGQGLGKSHGASSPGRRQHAHRPQVRHFYLA